MTTDMLAEATRKKYHGLFSRFATFAAEHGSACCLPADPRLVEAFIRTESDRGRSPSTIKTFVSAIAHQHVLHNHPDPTLTLSRGTRALLHPRASLLRRNWPSILEGAQYLDPAIRCRDTLILSLAMLSYSATEIAAVPRLGVAPTGLHIGAEFLIPGAFAPCPVAAARQWLAFVPADGKPALVRHISNCRVGTAAAGKHVVEARINLCLASLSS